MPQPKPKDILTFADVARLDADEVPGELDAGRWDPVTRSTWRHGVVVGNIVFALKLWARDNTDWQVATADPGVKLDHDPDVLRGPDVGVIHKDRAPTGHGEAGWLNGAPDFVVEVAGDAQAPTKLIAKALEFLDAGAQLVWIVDPQAEQVAVYRPGNLVELVREGAVGAGDVLPGFTCALAELFA